MDKKQINYNLNMIMEGKIWDKVKKGWRDHKGNIIKGAKIAGTVAAVAAGGAGAGMLFGQLTKPSIKSQYNKVTEPQDSNKEKLQYKKQIKKS